MTNGSDTRIITLPNRKVKRNQTVTVKNVDGTIVRYKLAPGTEITDIHIFAGASGQKPVKVAKNLEGKTGIPERNWTKVQGRATVLTEIGTKKAILHWFEANGKEFSMKVVKWE